MPYVRRSAHCRTAAGATGKLEAIEREVQQLDDETFEAFRDWFMSDETARWDRRLASESTDETLDSLLQEPSREYLRN
jgi:hypothetical protein